MREPTKFGNYYLVERIAVGGMAEVFKAVSYGVEGFERQVALKRVLPDIAQDQEFVSMFIDEAKIAVQLRHANISQIFDLGNAEGSYFIAMEFVSGKDLRAVWDRARKRHESLDIAMCCHVVKEVCEALEYAHSKCNDRHEPLNLIHRDISPQNIILSYDGETKLIDFGIAKATGRAQQTQAGVLKGKFGYMSPEQVRGRPIDRRSDLFSLAVVLYELLTLERCFQGATDFSTLEKVRNVDIPKPRQLNGNIPEELERIVMKGLARNPEDRYQTAAEFGEDLQRFLYQSGCFYARKDLSAYMRQVFQKEYHADQRRNAEFRDYAQAHIPEAGNQAADAGFQVQNPDLNWDDPELSTAVWERNGQQDAQSSQPQPAQAMASAPAYQQNMQAAGYAQPGQMYPQTYAPGQVYPPTMQPAITQEFQALAGYERQSSGSRRLMIFLAVLISLIVLATSVILLARHQVELKKQNTIAAVAQGATLQVESEPAGANVFLDGLLMGQTPAELQKISQGTHEVKLQKEGFAEYSARFPIQGDGPFAIPRVALVPLRVSVTFKPQPATAELVLRTSDGKETPLGIGEQQVANLANDGRAVVIARAEGFVPLERPLPKLSTLNHTEFLNLVAVPAPQQAKSSSKPSSTVSAAVRVTNRNRTSAPSTNAATKKGTLKLTSKPPAEVFIGGKSYGWTPLQGVELPPGTYSVDLKRGANYPMPFNTSIKVNITAGQETFERYVN